MKPSLTLMAVLFLACAAMRAQVVPTAVGPTDLTRFARLPVSGSLRTDLHYSETSQIGNSQDGQQQSIVSGNASYTNISQRLPFSMQYGGGYGRVWAGPSNSGNVFQHLSLSQGFVERTWSLTASDNVSYSFQTPTTGFSGVPGTGDSTVGTGSTTSSDQTILTVNTRTLDNFTTVSASRRLGRSISLNVGGSAGQMRFIDGNGQDTDTLVANAGLSRRLDAHNTVSGSYAFSRYSYDGTAVVQTGAVQISHSQTESAQIGFSRQWNPKIITSASIGPQWISSSYSTGTDSSISYTASASASDSFKIGTASLSYNRGVNGGSGYMLGAESDTVSANFSRGIGKNLTVGVTGSYVRTSSLIAEELVYNSSGVSYLVPLSITPTTNARYGGAQVTRKLGKHWSAFANYTAVDQTSNTQVTETGTSSGYQTNILSGLTQVFGFGISYSPREKHFKW
jgi:hypothetical protein